MYEISGRGMVRKQIVVLTLLLLLFSIPSYATEGKDTEVVEKFGVGFDEQIIADSVSYTHLTLPTICSV